MIAESLNSYINYYISQPEPGYAVLITGEWGIGKTYQVMKVLPEEQTCYISLFGINTTSEIYASVFTAMYPGRSFVKKSANALKESTAEINGLTLGAGVLFSSLADALIKQTVDNSKIIIFDDLERCPLTTKEILGAINKYIEHHKCRVIVIAHDIEIESEFIKTKEKIIGHTIKIQPQIESAAKSFFNETTKIKHHTNIKKSIINAFKESKCQSLRILRHVIKDCNRLISCLKYSQITNNEAMNELFSTFTLMNIEFRLNNILPEEIRTLEEQLSAVILELPDEDEDDKASNRLRRLTKLFNKYTQETFTGGLLDSELLYSMLVDGVYPKKNN